MAIRASGRAFIALLRYLICPLQIPHPQILPPHRSPPWVPGSQVWCSTRSPSQAHRPSLILRSRRRPLALKTEVFGRCSSSWQRHWILLFPVPVLKLRWEDNILQLFQSISCLMFDCGHISTPKILWFGEKSAFLTQKNLISRYFTTFQLPNHLDLQM